MAVTLIGTNFIVGATSVVAAGGGVVVNNIVVGSTTSLTANFVIDPAAAAGARTVTVTTIGGTSNGQSFTIIVATGSTTFNFTGSPASFTVPAGVMSILVNATAPAGGPSDPGAGTGGLGGRAVATVPVAPGTVLTVRVGGPGVLALGAGGFNGGGATTGTQAGGGGGASSVHNGATPLVIAGGGGGAGRSQFGATGNGGNGGGLTA